MVGKGKDSSPCFKILLTFLFCFGTKKRNSNLVKIFTLSWPTSRQMARCWHSIPRLLPQIQRLTPGKHRMSKNSDAPASHLWPCLLLETFFLWMRDLITDFKVWDIFKPLSIIVGCIYNQPVPKLINSTALMLSTKTPWLWLHCTPL